MRAKRSFLALLFVLMIMLSVLMIPTGAANENATLKLTPIEALPGEEFTTTLYVTDGSEISDFMIELLYDTDIVQLVSAKPNKNADGGVTVNSDVAGVININYSNFENTYEEMPVVDFVFKVDDNAGPGSYEFLKENTKEDKQATRIEGSNYLDVPLVCDFEKLNTFTAGDIDLSGKVEIRDVTHLRRYLARLEELSDYQMIIADAYYDQSVNVRDAVFIQQLLAKYDVQLGNRSNIYFYDANGDLYATKSVIQGGSLTTAPLVPTKVGYSDGSWSLEKDEAVAPDFNNITKDIKVYAFYGETPQLNDDEYSISYHLYGNDTYLQKVGVTNPNPDKYSTQNGLSLKNASVPGYTFLGWYDLPDGEYAENIKSIPAGTTGTVDLYAKWKVDEYKISFISELIPVNRETYTVDEVHVLPVPKLDGYIFAGWSDGDGNLIKTISTGVTGNKTFTANWISERNQAWSKKTLDKPVVVEDDETNTILFAYDIGEIRNVPMYVIEDLGKINSDGVSREITKRYSFRTSREEMDKYANTVQNATTNSFTWTLSKGWSDSVTVDEGWAEEHGLDIEEAKSVCTNKTNNWYVSSGSSGYDTTEIVGTSDKYNLNTTTNNTKTYNTTEDETRQDFSAEFSVSGHETIGGDYSPIKTEIDVGASTEFGNGVTNKSKNGDEKDEGGSSQGGEISHEGTNVTHGSSWNSESGHGGSSSITESESVSRKLSSKLSQTYNIGKTYINTGESGEEQGLAYVNTNIDEYSSAVTFSKDEGKETSITYSTTNTKTGYHRLVLAGTAHVFAVVGYDIETASYFTYTYSIMDDETHLFEDYSYASSQYNDNQNTVLPFEVPKDVSSYVANRVCESEGLEVSADGEITAYNGTDTKVVIPEYTVKAHGDGTKSVIKVKSIGEGVFRNKGIESIELSDFITTIPDYAFAGCSRLTDFSANSITNIGNYAFSGCTSLKECYIGPKVTHLGEHCFDGLTSLAVDASKQSVVEAAINSGAEEIIVGISSQMQDFGNTELVIPSETREFIFNGYAKTFQNVRIVSDADRTVINRAGFVSSGRAPLELSSDEVRLNEVTVQNSGIALALKEANTSIELRGINSLNSSYGNALLCKNVTADRYDNSYTTKLKVNDNALVCGSIVDEKNLIDIAGETTKISEEEFNTYLKGVFKVTFDPQGGTVPESTMTAIYGKPIGTLPTPTRDNCSFEGWYMEDGTRVTEETVMDISNDITLKAHWKSGWILETDLPSDGTVQDSKWTYTLTTRTTSNSSTAPAGYTQYKDPTWVWGSYGAWSGWSRNSVSSSDSRKVETRTVTDSAAYTNYKYYIYRTSDGYGFGTKNYYTGSAHGSCTIYDEINLSYTLPVYDSSLGLYGPYNSSMFSHAGDSYWFYSGSNYVPAVTHTEWRYADRSKVYTYYYQKVEQKESATEVTASDTVSNVQKWVQYVVE